MKEKIPAPIYPYTEWKIIEQTYDESNNQRNETIFSLGNGYIGMRGNFEEGFYGSSGQSVNGTYLNGFYESEPIYYPEGAHGYARHSQTMLNVTDAKHIQLYIDGELFHLSSGRIHSFTRELDMQKGILKREILWESPSGNKVKISINRMVSLKRKHVAAITYEVQSLNFEGVIKFVSSLEGNVTNQTTTDDPRAGSSMVEQVLLTQDAECHQTLGYITQQTRNTKFDLIAGMEHCLTTEGHIETNSSVVDQTVSIKFNVSVKNLQVIQLTKWITYHTSLDFPTDQLIGIAKATLTDVRQLGFESLLSEQIQFLQDFWSRSDVQVKGEPAVQQSIRYNSFQLLQSVGRDGRTNIGAKGLTGEGYEGHYFWDTETYIQPFFLYTQPEISRRLLEYRYHTLNHARNRANEMNQKGALFAWRTINGEETSAYYPAGTAQVHINADVIYALKKYVKATGDIEFLHTKGAEMLVETSRFWSDLGYYNPSKNNQFCINTVTGPDEYTAIVDNNAFTNLMVKDCLEFTVESLLYMKLNDSVSYYELVSKVELDEAELEEWKRIADHMYIPYNVEFGIVAQDDTFLNKKIWDFEHTPKDKYPLLLHYHPLVLYRHQVLKQADVVLALFLLGNRFSLAEKKRNYSYYEPITTHDSSLSPCIHSIIATEIGDLDKAYKYFSRTSRMDLDDINGNVKDGVHTAAMAGTWLSIINGFAGMRDYEGILYFNPIVPATWDGYEFNISHQGCMLNVNIDKFRVVYTLIEGTTIDFYHNRDKITLVAKGSHVVQTARRLEAVILDLDGVITDSAEYHYQAWKQLADQLGLPFDREYNERLKGVGRIESLELILQQSKQTYSREEKESWAARKNDYYVELIDRITKLDVLPGIMEFLIELKANQIKIALASASKNANKVLDKLEIRPYFDVVVDVTSIEKGKPDPEIFFKAAELLGICTANCIGIEDAYAGVQAIKGANMFAVGIGDKTILSEANLVLLHTSELSFSLLNHYYLQSSLTSASSIRIG